MSTQKLPANLRDKSNQEVTKMVPIKQENHKSIDNLIVGFYRLFGIETLSNDQFHLALKRGRKDFRKTRLINPSLVNINLDSINLSGVNLNKVNLSEASLVKAQLHKTKMVGANLDSANLKGANLSRANLKDAQASWADLRNTNLSNTVLYNANLTGADLDKSESILAAKIMFARFDHARLPYGVIWFRYFRFFMKKRLWAEIELIRFGGTKGPESMLLPAFNALGIPYIPSSTLRGIPREMTTQDQNFTDEKVKEIFGHIDGKTQMGQVIFLDAYPQVEEDNY